MCNLKNIVNKIQKILKPKSTTMDTKKPEETLYDMIGNLPRSFQQNVFNYFKDIAKEYTYNEVLNHPTTWYASKKGIQMMHVRNLLSFFVKTLKFDQFTDTSNEAWVKMGLIDLVPAEDLGKLMCGNDLNVRRIITFFRENKPDTSIMTLENEIVQEIIYEYYRETVLELTSKEVEGKLSSSYPMIVLMMHHFNRKVFLYMASKLKKFYFGEERELLSYGIIEDYYGSGTNISGLTKSTDPEISKYLQYFLSKGSYSMIDYCREKDAEKK